MSEQDANQEKDLTSEDIRVAYTAAINLWAVEGELSWSRFNVMLVANSIIIAILGFLATVEKIPQLISLSIPVLGILLCAAWSSLMVRSWGYIRYWILSARELEGWLPSQRVKIVSRGGAAADGKPVVLFFDNQAHTHQMSKFGRITMQTIAQSIIIMF